MAVSSFVQVNILAAVAAPTQAAFNIGGVSGYHTVWTDLSRSYTSLSALNVDFPATASSSGDAKAGIAKAGAAFFAQSPNPGVFKVFRLQHKTTKTFTVTIVTAVDSTTYSFTLAGQTVSFTSGVGTTGILIAAGLVSAITALAITGVSAANSGTNVVTITGTAGTWFDVDTSTNPAVAANMTVLETTADNQIAADLGLVAAADPAWYGLVHVDHSKAIELVVAAWAESNSKVYFTSSQDSDCLTNANTDILYALKQGGYNRTAGAYHQNPGQFLEAALMGFFFPFTPGSANYFLKTLAGISASPTAVLNDTGVSNALAKNGNVYRTEAGLNVYYPGTMASGRFIDITTGVDYMTARLQNRLYAAMVNSQKIPYTQAGAAIIEGCIRSQIKEEIDIGFAADDSNVVVTVPAVSSQASVDRAARIMRNCNFTFRAAGAVQDVIVNGTVTV